MPKNADAEKNNPCLKEQDLSFKCLHRNDYDREKCALYFVNYNNCKEFWNKVQLYRRRRGIQPTLPNIEDRPKIKEEYIKSKLV